MLRQGDLAPDTPDAGHNEISMTDPEDTPLGAGIGGAFQHVRTEDDRVETHELTTSDLEDATVYRPWRWIGGKISALQLDEFGKLSGAMIGAGGVIGMGARSVLIPFSQLQMHRQSGGTDVRMQLDTAQDQLKGMPEHAC